MNRYRNSVLRPSADQVRVNSSETSSQTNGSESLYLEDYSSERMVPKSQQIIHDVVFSPGTVPEKKIEVNFTSDKTVEQVAQGDRRRSFISSKIFRSACFTTAFLLMQLIRSLMRVLNTMYINEEMIFPDTQTSVIVHGVRSVRCLGLLFGIIGVDNVIGRFKGAVLFSVTSVLIMFGTVYAIHSDNPSVFFVCLCLTITILGLFEVCYYYITLTYWVRMSAFKLSCRYLGLLYFLQLLELLSFIGLPSLKRMEVINEKDNKLYYMIGYGIVTALLFLLYLLFHLGVYLNVNRKMTNRTESSGSVYLILYGVSRWFKLRKIEPRKHFLDYGKSAFKKKIIRNTKRLISILPVLIPFPLFFSAVNQQPVSWTMMTKDKKRTIEGIVIYPEEFQAIGNILKMLFIPIFFIILKKDYKCFRSIACKLVLSYFFAGAAFFVLASLQRFFDNKSRLNSISSDDYAFRLTNLANCTMPVNLMNENRTIVNLESKSSSSWEKTETVNDNNLEIDIYSCENRKVSTVALTEKGAYPMVTAMHDGNPLITKPEILPTKRCCNAWVRFVVTPPGLPKNSSIEIRGKKYLNYSQFENNDNQIWTTKYEVFPSGTYTIHLRIDGSNLRKYRDLKLRSGSIISIVIEMDSKVAADVRYIVDFEPALHWVFYYLPMYVFIVIGELLFLSALFALVSRAPIKVVPLLFCFLALSAAFGDAILTIFKLITLYINIPTWDPVMFGNSLIVCGMLSGQGAYGRV